ncbi:polysaccharide deacetylase family protein [Hyunsoonleella aestuarii]|uniref:Polysaccharide deacetylase family protein n=1 Tax=Hyunsoonleella aestuarii TaxID=912802 RepID=A0ABP8EAI8_9FLAO|nr:polysaccharide deacetylase family protein [Hyunsoonleella aestuarii]
MNFKPIKTPKIAKKIFPNYIWDIPTKEKVIYLTFDDGPTPEITTWTLDVLKQYNAKATFFCIGNNIEKYPEIFKSILNEGHSVGNHTYNHLKGWKTKTKDYLKNISQAQKVFDIQTDNLELKNKVLFRPPYGKIKPKQAKKLADLGYKIVMWDVLSFDWDKDVTPAECFNNVLSKAQNGSVIVFHDSVKASKNMQFALPLILEHYNQQGFEFKAIKISV